MKNGLYYTGILILFGLIGIVIWEIVAILFLGGATISIFAEELASVSPFVSHCISMIFGILIGHWFIPPGGPRE